MLEYFTIGNFVMFGGYVIAGMLMILGMFGMQVRQRRDDGEKLTQNLISNYRLTVEQQEQKIKDLNEKEVAQGKEIAHLQGQVKVLTDILQGRDPEQMAVFRDLPQAIVVAKDSNAQSHKNGAAIERLTETFEKFINTLQPILMHIEAAQG